MLPADQRPTLKELRRLSTLADIDRKQLDDLANRLTIERAAPGDVLLERDSNDDSTLYLLQGRIRLEAADGKIKEIDQDDPSARDPIARLRPSRYQVSALTPLSYLRIGNDLLASLAEGHADTSTLLEFEVSEESELQQMPADNRLMIKIYQDLNADRLQLPSLPQVAVRIGEAMKDPNLDAVRLAKLVSADPAIAAKILKTANSARYAGKVPVATLESAIARLGLDTTHQLVLTFAIKELFQTGSGVLQTHMKELWKHSRRVAAISHVLASKLEHDFDPSFAMLAGLLHDIGVIALLGYARGCPDLTQVEKELDETVAKLNPQLGSAIIRSWHLPKELAQVAHEAEHWGRDSKPEPDYTDLVIIAQLHAFVGTREMSRCPRINEVPAYRKLQLGEVSPEFTLQLLDEAADEVREVEELLGA